MEIDEKTFRAAQNRASARLKKSHVATAAWFDLQSGKVIVKMSSGMELSFRPSDVQGLEGATTKDLEQISISSSGLGLHFSAVDADLYVPSLLRGLTGSARWIAEHRQSSVDAQASAFS